MLKRRLITSALAAALAAVAFVPASSPAGASTTSLPCESYYHPTALSDASLAGSASREGNNTLLVKFYLAETQGEVGAEAPNCDAMSYQLYVEQWGAASQAQAEDLASANFWFKPKSWPMTISYSGVQADWGSNNCGNIVGCPTAQRYVLFTVNFDPSKFSSIPAVCINSTAVNGGVQTDYLPTPGRVDANANPPKDGDEHRACFVSQADGGWGNLGNIIL